MAADIERVGQRGGLLFLLMAILIIWAAVLSYTTYGVQSPDDLYLAILIFGLYHIALGLNIFMLFKAPREAGKETAGEQAVSAFYTNPAFFASLFLVSFIAGIMIYDWAIFSQLQGQGLPGVGFQDEFWIEAKIPLSLAFAVAVLYFWFSITGYMFVLFAETEFGQLRSKFSQTSQTRYTISRSSFGYIKNIWVWTAVTLLVGTFVILMIIAFDIIDLGIDLEETINQAQDPTMGMLQYFADTRVAMTVALAWGLSILLAFTFNLTGGSGPKVQSLFGFGGIVLFLMILGLHEPFFAWLTSNAGRNAPAAFIGIGAGAFLFFFATNFVIATVVTLFTLSLTIISRRFRAAKKDEVYAGEGLALWVAPISKSIRKHRSVDKKMKRKLGRK